MPVTPSRQAELVDVSPIIKSSPAVQSFMLAGNAPTPRTLVDEESRLRREEEESIELARALMAEEAMASYENHIQQLRENSHNLSAEDFAAFQAVIEADEHQEQVAELEDDNGNLSYDTMLELGERIGDVKTERWTAISKKVIEKIPSFNFDQESASPDKERDDSEHRCLVCQCEYEQGEEVKRLPCGHCFHTDCVDQWLAAKDFCPYCRKTILPEE